MASIFGHAAFSFGVSRVFPRSIANRKVVFLGMLSSMLPDLDVISNNFEIWGLSMLGHRGLTHSLSYALVWSLILLFIFHKKDNSREKIILIIFYFICTASHGLLDAMTTGGDGIAFFAPFTENRYFLPWRFIQVSPLGISNFFSSWGLKVIISEIIAIGIPTCILIVLGKRIHAQNE